MTLEWLGSCGKRINDNDPNSEVFNPPKKLRTRRGEKQKSSPCETVPNYSDPNCDVFGPPEKDQGNVEISVMNTNLETLTLHLEMGMRDAYDSFGPCLQSVLVFRRFFVAVLRCQCWWWHCRVQGEVTRSMTTQFWRRLVQTDCPLITGFSVITEGSWKAKLLNNMLSPQQNTFMNLGILFHTLWTLFACFSGVRMRSWLRGPKSDVDKCARYLHNMHKNFCDRSWCT